jgi:inner membrane protein
VASPVGHALAGYCIYRLGAAASHENTRALLVLCLVMAISPDCDFLPGLLVGQPALFHQGVSHSLFFACLAGLGGAVAYNLYTRRGALLSTWAIFALSYTSHLIMDLFGPDTRPPFGIPLFWPITDATFLAPVLIFWGFHHVTETSGTRAEWATGIFDPFNVGAIGIEVGIILPVILVLWWLQVGRIHGSNAAPSRKG